MVAVALKKYKWIEVEITKDLIPEQEYSTLQIFINEDGSLGEHKVPYVMLDVNLMKFKKECSVKKDDPFMSCALM